MSTKPPRAKERRRETSLLAISGEGPTRKGAPSRHRSHHEAPSTEEKCDQTPQQKEKGRYEVFHRGKSEGKGGRASGEALPPGKLRGDPDPPSSSRSKTKRRHPASSTHETTHFRPTTATSGHRHNSTPRFVHHNPQPRQRSRRRWKRKNDTIAGPRSDKKNTKTHRHAHKR